MRTDFEILARQGVIVSTNEQGQIEAQKIDNPTEFAEENGFDFIPNRLGSDYEAKEIYNTFQAVRHWFNV